MYEMPLIGWTTYEYRCKPAIRAAATRGNP